MNMEMTIAESLKSLLRDHEVAIVNRQEQMVEFRALPIGEAFSKPRAHVLLWKRDVWRVFIDGDLTVTGNPSHASRLLPGPCYNQWQPFNPEQRFDGDIDEVLLSALESLNSPLWQDVASLIDPSDRNLDELDETDFDLKPDWHGELLDVQQFDGSSLELTHSQHKGVQRCVATMMRNETPICPVLVGPSGSGKSLVARLTAEKLAKRKTVGDVFIISGASLHAGVTYEAERDERLKEAFSFVETGTKPLVIFEHIDMLLVSTRLARSLTADVIDRGIRMIGVAQPDFNYRRLRQSGTLPRRIKMIQVDSASPAEMPGVLAKRLEDWPLTNDLEILPETVTAAVALTMRSSAIEPAATIGLLEAVLIDARERHLKIVGPDEVYHVFGQSDESS